MATHADLFGIADSLAQAQNNHACYEAVASGPQSFTAADGSTVTKTFSAGDISACKTRANDALAALQAAVAALKPIA